MAPFTPSHWPNQLEISQGRPADQLCVNNSDAPVLATVPVTGRGNQTNLIKSSTYFKLSCRPEPIANVIRGLDPYNDKDEWNPKYLGGQAVPVIGQGPGARVDSKPNCSRLSTSIPSLENLESVEVVLKGTASQSSGQVSPGQCTIQGGGRVEENRRRLNEMGFSTVLD